MIHGIAADDEGNIYLIESATMPFRYELVSLNSLGKERFRVALPGPLPNLGPVLDHIILINDASSIEARSTTSGALIWRRSLVDVLRPLAPLLPHCVRGKMDLGYFGIRWPDTLDGRRRGIVTVAELEARYGCTYGTYVITQSPADGALRSAVRISDHRFLHAVSDEDGNLYVLIREEGEHYGEGDEFLLAVSGDDSRVLWTIRDPRLLQHGLTHSGLAYETSDAGHGTTWHFVSRETGTQLSSKSFDSLSGSWFRTISGAESGFYVAGVREKTSVNPSQTVLTRLNPAGVPEPWSVEVAASHDGLVGPIGLADDSVLVVTGAGALANYDVTGQVRFTCELAGFSAFRSNAVLHNGLLVVQNNDVAAFAVPGLQIAQTGWPTNGADNQRRNRWRAVRDCADGGMR